MKKEKTVKTHTRRTKSGKTVVVKQHTAKYDAAEEKKSAAKRKGAGEELENRKHKIPDLISDMQGPWGEFENNFEEGWGGNPDCKCLANHWHHREVANLAAYNLSKIYKSETALRNSFKDYRNADKIIQNAYDSAAKKLYPREKLWSGDNDDNPHFWHEHFTKSGFKDYSDIWDEKRWGKFEDFGKHKSSIVKARKSASAKKALQGKKV